MAASKAKPRRAQSFLFEPAAFAGDPAVIAMSPMEVGAYIMLLCAAWSLPEPGVIPDNDTALSYLTRTGPDWPKCRAAVSRAFDTESRPGFWVQKRMVATHRQQSGWFARHSLAGSLGGKAKAANRKASLATQLALAKPTGSGSGSCSGTGSVKEKRERRARTVLQIPTLQESVAFAKEHCPTVDGERWWHYQVARGWRTKAGPIVNWHSAMRTWVNNGYEQPPRAQPPPRGDYSALEKAQRQRLEWEKENGDGR